MSISAWFVGGVLGAKAGASAQWKEAATKYASVGRIFGAAFAGSGSKLLRFDAALLSTLAHADGAA